MDQSAVIELLQSRAALIVAIGTLVTAGLSAFANVLGGIANVLEKLRALLEHRKAHDSSQRRRGPRRPVRLVAELLLIAVAVILLAARFTATAREPLNVRLTREAWDALNADKPKLAIERADECIHKFRGQADLLQSKLSNAHAADPPVGAVTESQKRAIHQNGLLNDVATCFFIKGEAWRKLGNKGEARQAYTIAKQYTYARCWDPQGWFWSISEAAEGQLKYL
jgi:hypothetical protein